MKHIVINWLRLLRYALLFIIFCILQTVLILLWFSPSFEEVWNHGLVFSITELRLSLNLVLTLFIFISFPVLLFRFLFFFSKMIYRGRKPGIAILNLKTLFNPINFLFLPSLLNSLGMDYRRRCLISLILLILLYMLMVLIIN